MKSLLLVLTLSLLAAQAHAEGSTLTSEKLGACALLTAADAQRVSNVPMEFQAGTRDNESPGRSCVYRSARPGSGDRTVHLRLLDAREWSRLKADADASKPEIEVMKGLGDEAYFVKNRRPRRPGPLTLYVRRGRSQFSLRFVGVGPALTDPMKQLARGVLGRL